MHPLSLRIPWRLRADRGQLEVIAAALAFAASVPISRRFLGEASPLALSGILYLSAGVFCGLLWWAARPGGGSAAGRRLNGAEWLWLGGATLVGAVAAPFLLFLGLRQVSGHVAGLLLNFEAVFTVGLGVLLSGERLGPRGWIGSLAVIGGALLLSLPGTAPPGDTVRIGGVACVVAACALWGLDNNLVQRVSVRDARQITALKATTGGLVSLGLAGAAGGYGQWDAGRLLIAAATGIVSFGLSIVLFIRGLRRLGVIQTGMLFALAPGFSAILCWTFLREPLAGGGVAALLAMTAGALLLVLDRHEHSHRHGSMLHSHEHHHDEHHQHPHEDDSPVVQPHVHVHRHEPLQHAHPHVHDLHHRHRH